MLQVDFPFDELKVKKKLPTVKGTRKEKAIDK